MAISSQQIGWSQKAKLLWNISKQLESLTGVMSKVQVGNAQVDYGNWTLVTGGAAGDGTVLIDNLTNNRFTIVGPNDGQDDGWVYLKQQFPDGADLLIGYDWTSFDENLEVDRPIYCIDATEPTGIPSDLTPRVTNTPESGEWNITVNPGEWFSIGIYANDSCCGRGFLEVGININPYTTTTTTTAAPAGNVDIAASTDFDITGDFTIEMFVNMSNLNGFPRPYSFGAYPAPNAMSIEGGQLYFWANNANLINGSFSPNLGEWYHICVMGAGSTAYMFINGFMVASSPYGGSISSQGLPLTIGFGNEPSSEFNGLMSNFRWSDIAMYPTTGFSVPTTPLALEPNTIMLIFQGTTLNNQLVDQSGNGHNATNSGATYSALNPFAGYEGSLQMGTV